MSMNDAIDLVLFAFKNGKNRLFVKKSPAATIKTITEALAKYLRKRLGEVIELGIEKIHETLLTKEEQQIKRL